MSISTIRKSKFIKWNYQMISQKPYKVITMATPMELVGYTYYWENRRKKIQHPSLNGIWINVLLISTALKSKFMNWNHRIISYKKTVAKNTWIGGWEEPVGRRFRPADAKRRRGPHGASSRRYGHAFARNHSALFPSFCFLVHTHRAPFTVGKSTEKETRGRGRDSEGAVCRNRRVSD